MGITVEHDKRRKQILKKALDVFIEEGFEAASYQKIADRSKITRTTLYMYFRNRQEIFNFSIKQFLSEIEQDIIKIKENSSLTNHVKLKKTLFLILSRMEENRRLLLVILDYLLSKSSASAADGNVRVTKDSTMQTKQKAKKKSNPKRSEILPDARVRRRTIRLRHILSYLIIAGMKSGELKKIDVGTANDMFFGIIEAAFVRLTVLKRETLSDSKETVELAVNSLIREQVTGNR